MPPSPRLPISSFISSERQLAFSHVAAQCFANPTNGRALTARAVEKPLAKIAREMTLEKFLCEAAKHSKSKHLLAAQELLGTVAKASIQVAERRCAGTVAGSMEAATGAVNFRRRRARAPGHSRERVHPRAAACARGGDSF